MTINIGTIIASTIIVGGESPVIIQSNRKAQATTVGTDGNEVPAPSVASKEPELMVRIEWKEVE